MKLLAHASRQLTCAVSGCALTACGYLAPIDACERDNVTDQELNFLTDGLQYISTPGALAALPDGSSLLTFVSVPPSVVQSDADAGDVRAVVLDSSGIRRGTCGLPNEISYAPQGTEPVFRGDVSAVGPAIADGEGLVTFVGGVPESPGLQVWGQLIDSGGCPLGGMPPFQISDEPPDYPCSTISEQTPIVHCATSPTIVRLGGYFAVVWLSLHQTALNTSTRIMGRVYNPEFLGAVPVGTMQSSYGAPVQLSATGARPITISAVGILDDRLVVAWQEQSLDGWFQTFAQVYTRRFERMGAQATLQSVATGLPDVSQIHGASRGNVAMFAWSARDPSDRARVYGKLSLITDAGIEPVIAAPTDSFALGSSSCTSEDRVSVTAVPDRRVAFVAAWRGTDCGTSGASVDAVSLSEAGEVLFSNRSCEQTAFRLDRDTHGTKNGISIQAMSGGGSIQTVWTSVDRSSSGLRGSLFKMADLVPEEY